jgi:serine/threonine protein kinase
VSERDGWGWREGDAITAELTAMRLLGGGASYEAYLAFDEITYSAVVVKVLRPGQVTDASSLRGLRREVAALAAVRHPVVVRGLRHVDDGDRPHLVLEHVDGPRLSSLIRRHGPLQEQQYLPLAIDVASALHYFSRLEGGPMVHLDIKPSNVIMGSPARLIDLSVMRTAEDAAALTYVIGTDAYLAPEQAVPGQLGVPGPASDVWGLGATLAHAVSGERPFADGDPDGTTASARHPQLLADPLPLLARTPPEVVKVVRACLERRPDDRPQPHEVADTLQPVLERQPRARLSFKVR